jgi:hypothetical protein
MNQHRRILAAGVALAACAATLPAVAAAADPQPVTLRFAAQVNGQPFACGQRYADIGSTRSTITPGDLRFYVSEVALVDETGRAVPVTLAMGPAGKGLGGGELLMAGGGARNVTRGGSWGRPAAALSPPAPAAARGQGGRARRSPGR